MRSPKLCMLQGQGSVHLNENELKVGRFVSKIYTPVACGRGESSKLTF